MVSSISAEGEESLVEVVASAESVESRLIYGRSTGNANLWAFIWPGRLVKRAVKNTAIVSNFMIFFMMGVL